jgi:hypothetical protein
LADQSTLTDSVRAQLELYQALTLPEKTTRAGGARSSDVGTGAERAGRAAHHRLTA